jgi:hypothetical protein
MTKVNEEERPLTNEVNTAVNMISGACTAPLVDMIDNMSENKNSLRYMQSITKALFESKRFDEAIKFIHLLHDISGLNYPDEIALIETNGQLTERFIGEFLLDLEDLMYEYYPDEC